MCQASAFSARYTVCKPVKIAVVALLEDGSAFTSTYGDCGPYDMGTMAFHLQADALLEVMKANAGDIIDAAEEEEGETWQED